jgi:hypothetical protein
MSALAAELRSLAAIYWREADHVADPDAHRLLASAWHEQALRIEAGVGIIDSIDDCTEVYADPADDETILTELDLNNDCSDPGGHVWLAKDGEVRCIHCDRPAMPVYASREAE